MPIVHTSRPVHHAGPELEAELAETAYADLQMQDDGQCRDCGDFTSGSTIGGGHVQLCDGCIVAWVLDQIGPSLVRETLHDLSA